MKIFSWLILIFLFLIPDHIWVSGQCLDHQKSLLSQFKRELTFNSSVSTKLVNWNSSLDCCQWKGVGCNNLGHIIQLELDNEAISGGIGNSSTLFNLQNLERLNLAFNTLNGTEIPKGLKNLTHLQYLNLSNAGFGRQIPIEISKMTTLVLLDLSSQFQGALPLKLDNTNLRDFVRDLSGLEVLYLDGINLTDPVNSWWEAVSSLQHLKNLSLRHCGLSGNLESSVSQIRLLSVLRLDRNNLSTTNLANFANFTNLSTLTLSSCSLQGYFPEAIFQVATLQYLDLSNNMNLSGTISSFPPGGSFNTIMLRNTNFLGLLPNSIGNLRMLSIIDLSYCNFSGSIPSEIANLSKLANLDFSFNKFSGPVPILGTLENLVYIDLSHNGLNGTLLDIHFAGLPNLSYLNLGDNLITGNIPPSIFNLSSLQKLFLSNNKLNGQVSGVSNPNSLNLDTLDLSRNLLEGSLPKFFFNITRLNVLSLPYNLFNGTINFEKIKSLPNLTNLNLAYNNLSIIVNSTDSEFPPYPNLTSLNLASCNLSKLPNLRNQNRLKNLDLSNNNIQEELPSWIWKIGNGTLGQLNLSCNFLMNSENLGEIPRNLSLLDLHSNKLQGKMPVPPVSAVYVDYSSNNFTEQIDMEKPISAIFFSAANNRLTGEIPISLCNATNLQVLDLSGNLLSGSIPDCLLQNNKNLGVLNLGNNRISGNISDTFSVSCALRTLDLSNNNIQGNIPASLANCRFLEVMNVGNNNVNDGFPCNLKSLSSLRVLVMRSNKFNGEICCGDNHGWPNLQIIDIASNNFNGYLTEKCISSWKGMMLNNTATRGHLKFTILKLANLYYQDTVTVTLKGLELELQKTLTLLTSIDFSRNHFQGRIPNSIGNLSSLSVLNLSHNSFEGNIPISIGKLAQLESLDLSENHLTGEIPQVLASLTFLSVLDLSYNNLVGKIPTGPQFQTFSSESYEGNKGLCGFPLSKGCGKNETARSDKPSPNRAGFNWQFIFTGLGAGAGAALVIAPLAFCKIWREQCDDHLDRFLKLIFPGYGFSYIRCYGKVAAAKKIEDESTDSSDDDEKGEIGEKFSIGRYCVFCTKIDMQMTMAFHNSQCTCHYKPLMFSSSDSSSSSLLVVYSQRF